MALKLKYLTQHILGTLYFKHSTKVLTKKERNRLSGRSPKIITGAKTSVAKVTLEEPSEDVYPQSQ